MSKSYACRLLIDPPADGAWNMAVDEALLEAAAEGDPVVWLRFYQWQAATLSLGYFQPFAPWREHVRGECAVVRRQTGGGAILHDRELTYSLVLPPRHPLGRTPHDLYVQIHGALIVALRHFDIAAELWGGSEAGNSTPRDEQYLCFERRSACDVVVWAGAPGPAAAARGDCELSGQGQTGHYKICGSAQRRRRGALLVHGSLLLSASSSVPQILGIEELTGHRIGPADVCNGWLEELAGVLGCRPASASGLPGKLIGAVERIQRERYGSRVWTARR